MEFRVREETTEVARRQEIGLSSCSLAAPVQHEVPTESPPPALGKRPKQQKPVVGPQAWRHVHGKNRVLAVEWLE